ncbi:MAG: MoaD/ThiS family protein [Gammaproteobacteria bacterium]|nr:MoaD/ThiS family protein [Gammaproteobacteria bacterium]MBL6999607.1 MoaD/ThiS family protein [Gammaproteobacteria bacterium]
MKVYIELYASLMALLPPGTQRFRREIIIDEGSSVQQLIDRFSISAELAHIVLLNGHFVCGDARKQQKLAEEDSVAIWPPVAGG